MCFSICNRSFILLLSILILFSSCGISKKEYHNDIFFLNSENVQLQEEVDKLQAIIDRRHDDNNSLFKIFILLPWENRFPPIVSSRL